MSSYRVTSKTAIFLTLVLSAWACSSDDERPAGTGDIFGPGTGGSGGAGGTAGTAGATGESGSGGASGAAGDDAGTTGGTGGDPEDGGGGQSAAGKGGIGGGQGECGNNVLEPGERCDGNDFGSETCETLGFESGDLVCGDCDIDTSQCVGTEVCFDATDNDNDSDADCADDDCAAYCADPCTDTPPVEDPGSLTANNSGHPVLAGAPCGATGPGLGFQVHPLTTGVIDLTLTSTVANLAISARSNCGSATSEIGCADFASGPGATERLTVVAQQGVPVYVFVAGSSASDEGEFVLEAASRAVVCGDGHRDPGEDCDDGGTSPNDGCSPTCVLEPSESEPNGTAAQASAYVDGFVGSIDPQDDVDFVRLTADHPLSNIVVHVFDLGDGACTEGLMDPYVTIYAANGTTVLAEDDDSGEQYCPHTSAGGLGQGDYFVAVRRGGAGPATFPYFLSAVVDWCGNGMKSETEECDDGNNDPGDGCQADCTL